MSAANRSYCLSKVSYGTAGYYMSRYGDEHVLEKTVMPIGREDMLAFQAIITFFIVQQNSEACSILASALGMTSDSILRLANHRM